MYCGAECLVSYRLWQEQGIPFPVGQGKNAGKETSLENWQGKRRDIIAQGDGKAAA